MLNFKIDDAAKYVALLSASLYAAGFLIVNSNLAKYGDFDPDFASSRYIFAGFLFVWYMTPFSVIVLKPVYDAKGIRDKLRLIKRFDRKTYYSVGIMKNVLEPVNQICGCAIVFGATSINGVNYLNYKNYLNFLVLLIWILAYRFLKDRSWRTQSTGIYVMHVGAISVFVVFSDFMLVVVAFTYFLPFFFFRWIIKPLTENFSSLDGKMDVLYYGLSSIIVLLMFGDMLYGHVKHEYGGGLPVKVTVYIKSDAGTVELAKAPSGGFAVDMIALNDKKLIGISGGKLAIINADGIASVVYPEK